MSELVKMYRRLADPDIAWDASRVLEYAQPESIEQVPMVLEDDECDHADDISKYAFRANEALARAVVNHHKGLLKLGTPQLFKRRSSRFRSVIANYHSENPKHDFADILRLAIGSRDESLIAASLSDLRSLTTIRKLQDSTRDAVFDLVLELCTAATGTLVDVPSLLAALNPQRARIELASESLLKPTHPLLASILRNACELDSDVSARTLLSIFDQLDCDDGKAVRSRSSTLAWVARLATRKQDAEYEPVLEKASHHRDRDVKQIGLLGLVRLRLPHDPFRSSMMLVDSKPLKSIANPVKVVALTSIYLDEVEEQDDGLLTFVRRTSSKRFRHTLKALGLLKATPHVNLLTWVLEELGENPKACLKEMRRSELNRLSNAVSAKERRLNFDRLRCLLYRFILENESAFS